MFVPKEQDLKCGDYLKIRSEYHKLLGIGRDMYKPNFDTVRFYDTFKKGATNCKYNIVKPPVFIGNTVWLPKNSFTVYINVIMQINKIDSDNFWSIRYFIPECMF